MRLCTTGSVSQTQHVFSSMGESSTYLESAQALSRALRNPKKPNKTTTPNPDIILYKRALMAGKRAFGQPLPCETLRTFLTRKTPGDAKPSLDCSG